MKMIQRQISVLTTVSLLAGAVSGLAQVLSAGYPTTTDPWGIEPSAVIFGENGLAGVVSGVAIQEGPGYPVNAMYQITGGFENYNAQGSLVPGVSYAFAGTAGDVLMVAPPCVTSPFQYEGQNIAALFSFGIGINNGGAPGLGGMDGPIGTFYDFLIPDHDTLAASSSYFPPLSDNTVLIPDNYPGPDMGAIYTPTIGKPGYNQYFGQIPYYFITDPNGWPASAIPQLDGTWGPPDDPFAMTLPEEPPGSGEDYDPFASSIPEPSTWLAGVLLLLPFGASALRISRTRQTVSG